MTTTRGFLKSTFHMHFGPKSHKFARMINQLLIYVIKSKAIVKIHPGLAIVHDLLTYRKFAGEECMHCIIIVRWLIFCASIFVENISIGIARRLNSPMKYANVFVSFCIVLSLSFSVIFGANMHSHWYRNSFNAEHLLGNIDTDISVCIGHIWNDNSFLTNSHLQVDFFEA